VSTNYPLREKARNFGSIKAEITLRRVFRLNVVDLQPILDEGECHSAKAGVKK
jgi:hypothetical protein